MIYALWRGLLPAAKPSPRSRAHARTVLLVWEFAGTHAAASFLVELEHKYGPRHVKAVEIALADSAQAAMARAERATRDD